MARRSAASLGERVTCWLMNRPPLRLKNGAGFEKRLDPVSAIFTANPGVFESSPGGLRIIRHVVDHHASGSYLGGDTTCALDVGPKDRRVQTVLGVVRDPDRLLLGVIGDES